MSAGTIVVTRRPPVAGRQRRGKANRELDTAIQGQALTVGIGRYSAMMLMALSRRKIEFGPSVRANDGARRRESPDPIRKRSDDEALVITAIQSFKKLAHVERAIPAHG